MRPAASTPWRALALVFAVALAACGGRDTGAPPRSEMRIVFVSDGPASDPFWAVVAKGAREAAADLGVRLDYESVADPARQAEAIRKAAASGPTGIVTTIPDPRALEGALREVVDSGVPVVSTHSGERAWIDFGILAHVGQSQGEAGARLGDRLLGEGVETVVYVVRDSTARSTARRLAGLRGITLGDNRLDVEVLPAGPDSGAVRSRVDEVLARRTPLDAFVTDDPADAPIVVTEVAGAGREDEIETETFGMSPEVARLVASHAVDVAVDEQPYLQGYLPVTFLVTYAETGAIPGAERVVRTGPRLLHAAAAERAVGPADRGRR